MTEKHSQLINFYLGNRVDYQGRKIEEIWLWNNNQLENTHNFIQWLFPLSERSAFNLIAPTLTNQDIRCFLENQDLQNRLLKSFDLMLNFYGYQRGENQTTITIVTSTNHQSRIQQWVTPSNHNFLRITRILKCLTLLGLSSYSTIFFSILEDLYLEKSDRIGKRSFNFWQKAILGD